MILVQFSSLQINLILVNSLDAEGDVLVKSVGAPHVLCRLRMARLSLRSLTTLRTGQT